MSRERYTALTEGKWVVDIANSEGGYNYYGYIGRDSSWVIMRESTAQTEYRFAFGGSGYSTAWTNRATQSYKRTLAG